MGKGSPPDAWNPEVELAPPRLVPMAARERGDCLLLLAALIRQESAGTGGRQPAIKRRVESALVADDSPIGGAPVGKASPPNCPGGDA